MIWEAYQQTKIAGAERAAERAESKANRQSDDLAALKRHVDRLSLACQAMWELLRDGSELTEDDIEAKILEVDARDGRVDGKIAMQALECPNCGRPTNSKRSSCVICGAPFRKLHQFEG